MGLRVNTNTISLNAQRNLFNTTNRLSKSLERLSSGFRINRASDDAAGLAISEKLRKEIRSLQVAQRNALDGISLAQIGEAALQETSSLLIRMRELAVQSNNGTLGTNERASLDQEFQALITEIDRIAAVTEFNGVTILQSAGVSFQLQVGVDAVSQDRITISGVQATASSIGIDALSIGTSTGAAAALAVLDSAVTQVTTLRSTFGTVQNRLESTIRSLGVAIENSQAAESRIRDLDIAAETATLTREQVLQQAGVAVLAQANLAPSVALSLLQ